MSPNHNSINNGIAGLLHNMSSKEAQYREACKTNHGYVKATATRMNDSLEETMRLLTEGENPVLTEEEMKAYLAKQKQILKDVTKENIQDSRTVDSFLHSVCKLRDDLLRNGGEDCDYASKLREYMEAHKSNPSNFLALEHEPFYREVLTEMGEELAAAAGQNDDDDIQMVGGASKQTLKCPLTTVLLEDPMKNSFCGHVYSRAAVMEYLNSRQRRCPVAGCRNNQFSASQLAEDEQTALLVRRERKRLERESQKMQSQTELVDTDEED
ncbi:hypothetical protein FisN_6Hh167 [Fistulifera solaris]|jgi:hypothetical protein|uniref:SP-RING-type domain-containing protein n=1 Tax=Fistulifera solaris TaxID=1519565 RepID=A0A1Z5JNR0_FISSO|nr:hypothetical protein FisN_6Hh167 [Fistulifera solaris]|eukprot:GAX15536.1 hypothetical protein FisN_6Hh167 [Fistulifera solaris]